MRLLDLFCGAGGAAMGYARAGFQVVGVDNQPQPNYPFEFHQADATKLRFVDQGPAIDHGFMTINITRFDAIHTSPPCQRYSQMSNCRPGLSETYLDQVLNERARLTTTQLPWVIENVPGSPTMKHSGLFDSHGVELCGHMFGLALYRHRHFESNVHLYQPDHPRHFIPGAKAGHWKPGEIISVSGNCSPIALAKEAMGIHWMSRAELAEAIPPAYTQFIGEQLLSVLTDTVPS